MYATPSASGRSPGRDPLFFLALLAGPACWLVLYFILQPVVHWSWPLSEPWHYLLPALFYPVVEEIVFRGLVQELVLELCKPAGLY